MGYSALPYHKKVKIAHSLQCINKTGIKEALHLPTRPPNYHDNRSADASMTYGKLESTENNSLSRLNH